MTSPWDAEAWDWDEGNESELWAHRIAPEEAEQVWANGCICAPNTKGRAGAWKLLGRTDGGRSLTVIVRVDKVRRTMRPITGWDMTKGEKTRYFNGGNP